MNSPKPRNIGRRRLLTTLIVGGTVVGAGGLYQWRRTEHLHRRAQSAGAARAADIDTGIGFLGALFARRLSDADVAELAERIRYGCDRDHAFLTELLALSRTLDRLAVARGLSAFRHAGLAERIVVVEELLDHDPEHMVSRLRRKFATAARDHAAARSLAAPRLARLYRRSGVPFRARGYSRWPGVPGHWSEYLTRPAGLA